MDKTEKKTLYDWAFRAGVVILRCLVEKHGGKRIVTLLKEIASGKRKFDEISSSDKEQINHVRDICEKKFKNIILSLRSELIPEKFRRELVNYIIETVSDCSEVLSFREEIKKDHPWTVNEFYMYSTAILSGFFDALQMFRSHVESIYKKQG